MELTPQQVNEFIANAILESTLGVAIKAAIDRVLQDMTKSYDNPFDRVIKDHVCKIMDKHVLTAYKDILEARVKAALETQLTEDVVTSIVSAAISKLRRDY